MMTMMTMIMKMKMKMMMMILNYSNVNDKMMINLVVALLVTTALVDPAQPMPYNLIIK
jgi:hypothetical protein